MGSEAENMGSEHGSQHELEKDRQQLQPTPPSGVSKKTLALWKKELKNLKTKDAGKKIDGLRYCARDDRFFREQSEVLTVITGFLSRVKMPEVITEALATFKILFTVSEVPAGDAAHAGATEAEPPIQLHPEENKLFVVEASSGAGEGAWKGGEPLVALFTAAVSPEIKIQAIDVFSILVEHCIQIAANQGNFERLRAFQNAATPAIALLSCLAADHAELQLSALKCISLLFRNPLKGEYLTAFDSNQGLQKIQVSLQRVERSFQRPVLEIIESFSLYECGRSCLRSSGAREAIQALLSATVEVTTTTISTAAAAPTAPIALTVEEATLMHGNVSIACRSLARTLCAKESPCLPTEFTNEDACIPSVINALLAILQRDISTIVSPPAPASAPAGNNAAAQAAAAAAAATAATLASLFPFSSTKCVDIITCLGRLIEKSEVIKQYAKDKGILTVLVQGYRVAGDAALHQSVDKLFHLCTMTVRDNNGEPDEEKRLVDPQIFTAICGSSEGSESAGGIEEKPALLAVDSVLAILESSTSTSATGGDTVSTGVVFRLVRWLSIVVDSPTNAQALGEAAMSVIVKILLDSRPSETVLCGFLSKLVQAIASESPEACELCSTEARNPVSPLVAFLHAAYPSVDAMAPHRAASVSSEIETLGPVETLKSDETIEAEASAFVQFKLEWLNEFDEPDVFESHSLTQQCHAIDPFFFAARTLEVFASAFTRGSSPAADASAATATTSDFAELLTQRLEACGKTPTSSAAAGKKKPTETTTKSVSGEAIVVCVLEKTPEIFKILSVFSSKNADVAVSLLKTITTLAQLPGGVRALLLLAKTALEAAPIETETETGETASVPRPFVPHAWPWTREEAQYTEHSWLIAPIMAVFQASVTCFFQLEAAVACLTAITTNYEPEPTPSGPPTSGVVSTIEIPINDSDRFVNAALSQGILVYLVAVLDVERIPRCPREHHLRQEFVASTVAVALQFIERGTHKQMYALARRQELLELYDQLTAAAAASAAAATGTAAGKGAKQEHAGPTIDVASLHNQKLEYKSHWATELLDGTFDLPRFCYRRVTALLLATQIGQVEIANALLEAGVSPDATSPLDATTPLMLALLTRNKPLAKALLQAGATVDAITQDGFDVSVWACALASPIRDDLATLISRIHSSTIGNKMVMQLDALIELDSEDAAPDSELFEAILKLGVDVNVSNAHGDFLFHALLSKCVVRKRMRGLDMCFRYNSTRRMSEEELLRLSILLVEHHCAELDACNKLGHTPLHLALLYGHGDIALYLLERGANPNIVDTFGFLPLHYACLGFSKDATQAIAAIEAILAATTKHDLREGTHIDRRKHKTPLEKAAVDVDAMLDRGFADVSAPPAIAKTLAAVEQVLTTRSKSPDGFLPWHLACGATSELNASAICLSDDMNARLLTNGGIRARILTFFIEKHKISLDNRTAKQLTGFHLAVKTDIDGSNAPVIDVLLSQPSLPSYLNAVHEPTGIDSLIPIAEGNLVELTTDALLYVPHAHVSTRSLQHKYHVILPDGTHLENLNRHQLKVSSSSSCSSSPLASRYMLHLESAFSALHYAIQTSDAVATKLLDQSGISTQPEGSDLPLLALACAARRSASVVARLVNPQVNVRVHLPLHDGSSQEQGSSHSDQASGPGGRAASRKQAAALHFAVMYEDAELVHVLVTRKDHTNVNVRRSGDGFTPLHIACGMGNMEIIKLLLDHGANFIQMSTVSSNSSGLTPFHLLIKEDGVENDKLKELITEGYITREMLLEGLGAPAMVSAKSNKQDEPRSALTTSSSAKDLQQTNNNGLDDGDNEMEISCVLLDEEEHNLSMYNHVQQLLDGNRGATGFCLRLKSELKKSDDVLTQFFNLLRGSKTAPPPNQRNGHSSASLLSVEETQETSDTPRVAVQIVADPTEDASVEAARLHFTQLKHWHECYAQQKVRSQWTQTTTSAKMLRRSSFDRRSTRQLLLEAENDAGKLG